MKNAILLLGLFLFVTEARAYLSVNLNDVCDHNDGDETKNQVFMIENTELRFSQKNLTKLCHLPLAARQKNDWNLNIYFGPFLAFYKETELQLDHNGKQILLSHVNPQQRHSMEFYDLSRYKKWTLGSNPAQIFDEPQNKLTVEYESQSRAFRIGLEYLHPKIVFYNDETHEEFVENNPEIMSNVGTDEEQKYFALISTTKNNIIMNLYMDKKFEIMNIDDKFKLNYIFGAGIGLHGSQSLVEFRNQYFHRYQPDEKWNVQGYTGNIRNRLEFNVPKARLNLRLSHDLFFIRYNAKEGETHLQTDVWGNFLGAQLGFTLF